MQDPLPMRLNDDPMNSSKEELYEAKLEELLDFPEHQIGPATLTDKFEIAKYKEV